MIPGRRCDDRRRRRRDLFAFRHVGLAGSLLATPLAIRQAVDAAAAL